MLQESNKEIVIYYLAGSLFVALLVLAIIIYIILHHRKVSSFRYKLKQEEMSKQQSVYAALQEGEYKERNRLAEELHDGVGAKLSGIKMKLDYLRLKITDNDIHRIVEEAYQNLDESINELRDISHNLYPAHFIDKDLKSSVDSFIEQLNGTAKCTFRQYYEISENVSISQDIKLHCYRIITELLHNIYKHSNADSASVQILTLENTLQLIIVDNGSGYGNEVAFTEGIGLLNVKSRVSVCNGFINFDSSKTGTTIIIEIPL